MFLSAETNQPVGSCRSTSSSRADEKPPAIWTFGTFNNGSASSSCALAQAAKASTQTVAAIMHLIDLIGSSSPSLRFPWRAVAPTAEAACQVMRKRRGEQVTVTSAGPLGGLVRLKADSTDSSHTIYIRSRRFASRPGLHRRSVRETGGRGQHPLQPGKRAAHDRGHPRHGAHQPEHRVPAADG